MRIVVNDIAASSGGALSVLQDFYAYVCEHDNENEWFFLLSSRFFDETDNVQIIERADIKNNPIKKVIFDFFTGAKFINKMRPDVVFSMQNIITYGVKSPQVVYMHQALPFQHLKKFSFLKREERPIAIKQRLIGRIIKNSIKKADHVIVQTKWVKDAVCKDCGINEDCVTICRPKADILPNMKKKVSLNSSFFFYPTSTVPYKNNRLIFEASKKLTKKGYSHTIELTIDSKYSQGNVKCIGQIPYDQVIEKYKGATLVFPSYIETFGYPLDEARQVGTIVMAADTPFAREVLMGYENAYFFRFDSSNQLETLMERVIKGEIVCKNAVQFVLNETNENCWKSVINCVLKMAKVTK